MADLHEFGMIQGKIQNVSQWLERKRRERTSPGLEAARHAVGVRRAEADLAGMKARLARMEAERATGMANLTKAPSDNVESRIKRLECGVEVQLFEQAKLNFEIAEVEVKQLLLKQRGEAIAQIPESPNVLRVQKQIEQCRREFERENRIQPRSPQAVAHHGRSSARAYLVFANLELSKAKSVAALVKGNADRTRKEIDRLEARKSHLEMRKWEYIVEQRRIEGGIADLRFELLRLRPTFVKH